MDTALIEEGNLDLAPRQVSGHEVSYATRNPKSPNTDYDTFVDKFKPKKTTDDCYTPDNVYQACLDWLKSKGAL